jgi:hypothetical protein
MKAVPGGAGMDKDVGVALEKIVLKSLKAARADEERALFQPLSIQMETAV